MMNRLLFSVSMNENYAQFFTATILNWIPLLNSEKHKKIIVDSLSYLVEKGRCEVYAFVIMPNHIHLIWRMGGKEKQSDLQRDFLKFTAQQLRFSMIDNDSKMLSRFEVDKCDRKYQIWQRRPLSIDLYSSDVFEQKLDYIHANPVQGKWELVKDYVDYKYSSASFYELGRTRFDFLSHYMSYLRH